MKKLTVYLCAIVMVFGVAGTANSSLTIIGTATYEGSEYNLIYEDNNITDGVVWLDYSRSSFNIPFDGDSVLDWEGAMNWASGLGGAITDVNLDPNYTTDIDWGTGWRLPLAGINPQIGYFQNTSEMGHLYYESLGKPAGGPLEDTTPFDNLLPGCYWTAEVDYINHGGVWQFCFSNGFQQNGDYAEFDNVIAVRNGNVSATPIPSAIWLLGSAFIGLVGFRKKIRKEA